MRVPQPPDPSLYEESDAECLTDAEELMLRGRYSRPGILPKSKYQMHKQDIIQRKRMKLVKYLLGLSDILPWDGVDVESDLKIRRLWKEPSQKRCCWCDSHKMPYPKWRIEWRPTGKNLEPRRFPYCKRCFEEAVIHNPFLCRTRNQCVTLAKEIKYSGGLADETGDESKPYEKIWEVMTREFERYMPPPPRIHKPQDPLQELLDQDEIRSGAEIAASMDKLPSHPGGEAPVSAPPSNNSVNTVKELTR